MHRRQFLNMSSVLMGSAFLGPALASGRVFAGDNLGKYSARAQNLVKENTIIDMLSPAWHGLEWGAHNEVFTEADFQKIMASGINVFALGTHREDYHEMVAYLERLNDFIKSNSRYVEKIQTPQSLDNIKGSGKFGLMLTFQDSEHFRTADDVDQFWELGQSVSQITYNWQNRLGCGAFVDFDTGLTKLGRDVIRRMNRLGMAVDVSHCGDRTTLDAIEASDAPVLMTHATCRALNPGYPRAKTDEMIKKMAATGGVMGLVILRFMIRGREPVTVEHFLDHIDHMADLVGVEHIGIGSDEDLDTEDVIPMAERKERLENAPPKYYTHTNDKYLINIEGINHPLRTYDIAEGLIRRNYNDEQIGLILGGNFKRVLKQIYSAWK